LRIDEIPRDKPLVVMCHHGGRSERVAQFLEANGYDNAINLTGGIDAWSTSVDPAVPRY
jgi:rhodanese-related sulfurtransferase